MAFKLRSGNGTTFKNMGTSPFKDMKTGSYKQSFESPAKQRKGTEGQDQDKIFNDKGEHIGDYVNDKKVMHNDNMQKGLTNALKDKSFNDIMKNTEWMPGPPKRPKTKDKSETPAKQYAAGGTKKGKGNIFTKRGRKQRQLNKYAKEEAFENYEFYQDEEKKRKESSPAKQTKDTFKDGSKKSARDKFNDKETAVEQRKNGGRDNQKRKSIVGEKTSGFGPVAQKNNLTPKQNAVSRAEMKGIDSKSAYWYKIDGKTVSKKQYLNYENKPGNMEGGGKQTNHPDVYGRKASNHGRGPKTK